MHRTFAGRTFSSRLTSPPTLNKTKKYSRHQSLVTFAQANRRARGPQRLIPYILSIPRKTELYFQQRWYRSFLWSLTSVGLGFYSGNVVFLTFGALAINDIFAAVVTLIFYELITHLYYTAPVKTLKLQFANFFKIGLVSASLAECLKLGA